MNKEEIINELKYWLNFEAIQINKIEVINIINLIKDIEQQNQKYKEVIDKANDYIRACCNMDSKYVNLHYDYAQNGMSEDQVDELLDILKEVE